MNVNNVNMRFIENLCPPALLYLLFVTIQIGLDMSFGFFTVAAVKFVAGMIFVYLLDALCGVSLGIVSWAIVATPFIITSLATAIALGGKISGGNFNPAVTIMMVMAKKQKMETLTYIVAQIAGGIAAFELYRRLK
jgi:glycerol uptake facilitator-like aquaporin